MTFAWTDRDRQRFLRSTGDQTESGCMPWARSVDGSGYGYFSFRGKLISAHRAAYEIFRGPIPDGLHIDHLCRNRRCVNPKHLEAVTPAENIRRGAPATKTHCVNGHEFTPENTRITTVPGGGRRVCRACVRERVRRYKQRKKEAA